MPFSIPLIVCGFMFIIQGFTYQSKPNPYRNDQGNLVGVGLFLILCAVLYLLNLMGIWRIYKGENPITLGYIHPWTARNRGAALGMAMGAGCCAGC